MVPVRSAGGGAGEIEGAADEENKGRVRCAGGRGELRGERDKGDSAVSDPV